MEEQRSTGRLFIEFFEAVRLLLIFRGLVLSAMLCRRKITCEVQFSTAWSRNCIPKLSAAERCSQPVPRGTVLPLN